MLLLRGVGIEVSATDADHRRDLQLVVHLGAARRDRDVNVRPADRVGIAEVEDGQLVPVGIHLEAASLPCGAHVLLERIEVPNRRRSGYRREHLYRVELEDVMRISTQFIALRGEPRAVVTEEAEQRRAGLAGVDAPIDQQPGALARVRRLGERHPAHRRRRLRMSTASIAPCCDERVLPPRSAEAHPASAVCGGCGHATSAAEARGRDAGAVIDVEGARIRTWCDRHPGNRRRSRDGPRRPGAAWWTGASPRAARLA